MDTSIEIWDQCDNLLAIVLNNNVAVFVTNIYAACSININTENALGVRYNDLYQSAINRSDDAVDKLKSFIDTASKALDHALDHVYDASLVLADDPTTDNILMFQNIVVSGSCIEFHTTSYIKKLNVIGIDSASSVTKNIRNQFIQQLLHVLVPSTIKSAKQY